MKLSFTFIDLSQEPSKGEDDGRGGAPRHAVSAQYFGDGALTTFPSRFDNLPPSRPLRQAGNNDGGLQPPTMSLWVISKAGMYIENNVATRDFKGE
jgi:hypothetical protein